MSLWRIEFTYEQTISTESGGWTPCEFTEVEIVQHETEPTKDEIRRYVMERYGNDKSNRDSRKCSRYLSMHTDIEVILCVPNKILL